MPQPTVTRRSVLMTSLAALAAPALAAVPAGSAAASPGQVADATAGVNGTVYDTAQAGTRTYLGGSFTWVGPRTGSGVPVDLVSGVRTSVPRVNGTVYAVAADGAGGWYVGGEFAFAGGRTRSNAARINGSGTVLAAWGPVVNGPVRAIAVRGAVVYLAGSFTAVAGQSRGNLAAVSADTGALLPWNPNLAGAVEALAVSPDGATVYAAGGSGVSAFDAATGAARSWGPALTGAASALAVSGDTVYAGGPTGATAVDAATGSVTAWTAATDGPVRSIAVAGGTAYLGGAFTTVAGALRSRLAALSTATGAPTPWSPVADGPVAALALSADASTVYAGGDFRTVAGQARNRTAALLAADGAVTAWHPSADAAVAALALSGSRLLVGGAFAMLNGLPRRNAAALDANGDVDPLWNPGPDDVVYAVEPSADGAVIFLGGKFLNLASAARSRLAAVDPATGEALTRTAWPTAANGNVRALEVSGNRLYVGGAFTKVGGLDTGRLAALNATTGAVDTAFTPRPGSTVRALAASPDGSRLYAAGEFTTVAGVTRRGAAELDATTGALTAFNPSAGGVAIAVALTPDGSRLFFSTTSNRTYAYDPATGSNPVYTVRTGGDVQAIAVSATEVYIGGHFTTLPEAKLARLHAASFLAATGAVTAWNPKPDGVFGVWSIEITANGLLLGGDFEKVGGNAQPGFARMPGTA